MAINENTNEADVVEKKVTIKSLFENYSDDYKPTEVDFGKPVGKEFW